MNATSFGDAALTGWRRKLVDRVAPRLAAGTSLSRAQVRALAGALFLAASLTYVVRAFVRAARRAAREDSPTLRAAGRDRMPG